MGDHIKVANELLKNGHAYKCYCSNEEIEEQKNRAKHLENRNVNNFPGRLLWIEQNLNSLHMSLITSKLLKIVDDNYVFFLVLLR